MLLSSPAPTTTTTILFRSRQPGSILKIYSRHGLPSETKSVQNQLGAAFSE